MGWTVNYRCESTSYTKEEKKFFSANAIKYSAMLQKDCEDYKWSVCKKSGKMEGYTKIQYSEDPEKDFETILSAVQEIEKLLSKHKFVISDDYYFNQVSPGSLGAAKDVIKRNEKKAESGDLSPHRLQDYYLDSWEIKNGVAVLVHGDPQNVTRNFSKPSSEVIEIYYKIRDMENLPHKTKIYFNQADALGPDFSFKGVLIEFPFENREKLLNEISEKLGVKVFLPDDAKYLQIIVKKEKKNEEII